jgi:hypothetical protein
MAPDAEPAGLFGVGIGEGADVLKKEMVKHRLALVFALALPLVSGCSSRRYSVVVSPAHPLGPIRSVIVEPFVLENPEVVNDDIRDSVNEMLTRIADHLRREYSKPGDPDYPAGPPKWQQPARAPVALEAGNIIRIRGKIVRFNPVGWHMCESGVKYDLIYSPNLFRTDWYGVVHAHVLIEDESGRCLAELTTDGRVSIGRYPFGNWLTSAGEGIAAAVIKFINRNTDEVKDH